MTDQMIDAHSNQPAAKRRTVCLCVMVKNEAHILTKLLDSVHGVVDGYCIVDTGSTDGTPEVATKWASENFDEGTPEGKFCVWHRPWKNFGHNRTEALKLARDTSHCDFTLMLDADEQLLVKNKQQLDGSCDADVYTLDITLNQTLYTRRMLFNNAKPWAYKGVVHEVASLDGDVKQAHFAHWSVKSVHAGARSRDPHTYRRDAVTLQQALIDEPENERYVFYLAQSYFDCQEWELSKRYYTQRLNMKGWTDEIWFSLYRLAFIEQNLGKNELAPEAVNAFLVAYNYDPSRAEPLFALGLAYAKAKAFPLAHLTLQRSAMIKPPDHGRLFVQKDIYAWRSAMEFAVASYWLNDHKTAIEVNERLLALDGIPEDHREQIEKNIAFSKAKLSPQPKLA